MAERITRLELQAFRGIPGNFALDFQEGRSWIALGDNATGKSSIADAVEWYFDGQIEFLRKEGRTDAIRHSGAPEYLPTVVTLDTNGALGGTITTKSTSPPNVLEVGSSELYMLRGQSLAEFVDKTKGEKWKALAELLGLDAVDELRRDLQYVRNSLEDKKENSQDKLTGMESALSQLASQVSEHGILETVKANCEAAGVQAPKSFQEALDPEWITAVVPEGAVDKRVSTLQSTLTNLHEITAQSVSLDPIDSWNEFVDEGKQDVFTLSIFKAADSFLSVQSNDSGQCPLCGQVVDTADLRQRIATTLQELESAQRQLDLARKNIQQFVQKLRGVDQKRSSIFRHMQQQGIEIPENPPSPHDDFDQLIETAAVINPAAVKEHQQAASAWQASALKALQTAIPPPASTQEQALVNIGILHTRAQEWRSSKQAFDQSCFAFAIADRIFSHFQDRQRDYFKKIIEQISLRTAEIYRFLHVSEGVDHVAVETIGEKGAELSVKYYGKEEIPPHRVLSESHLNSLGLALFLAMAETFNNRIGFLVLDDVVSSFDREHRGRLAELLINDFADTQLIVLTHDELFFNRISVLGPSWIKEQFTSWSYERGPRTRRYDGEKLLSESSEALSSGDRIGAAQKGRRALEEFLQEACEALEALLPFRRGHKNDQRMAEEVMNGLRRTLRERAKPMYDKLRPLLQLLQADLQASLNVESHASQIGTSHQEINDALARIVCLRGHFTCDNCNTRIWHNGTPDHSRCKCGVKVFPPTKASS